MMHLRHSNPQTKHVSILIVDIIAAFPHMMLRRQTFPPSIQTQWRRGLPENIVNCMSISQLFVNRSEETRHYLFKCLSAETSRFHKDVHQDELNSFRRIIY